MKFRVGVSSPLLGLLLLIVIVSCCLLINFNNSVVMGAVILQQPISNQTFTLSAKTTYYIPSNMTFTFENSHVIIEPGVVLNIGNASNVIFRNTSVQAIGTQEDPILITSYNDDNGIITSTRFGCIEFAGVNTWFKNEVNLTHVHINNGGLSCTNFILSNHVKTFTMNKVHVSNITFGAMTLYFYYDAYFIDSVFDQTGPLTLGGGGGSNWPTNHQIVRNRYTNPRGEHAILIVQFGSSLKADITDNVVTGGAFLFFPIPTTRIPMNVIIYNNTLIDGTQFLHFDLAISSTLYNNSLVDISVKENHIIRPTAVPIAIIVDLSQKTTVHRNKLHMERNVIRDIRYTGALAVTFAGVSPYVSSLLDIRYSYNTMILATGITTAKFISIPSAASNFNPSDVIDARYNYYGTNDFTKIAAGIDLLTMDRFVPFSTEATARNDTPCPSVEPDCALRDIVCPDGYGAEHTGNLCSTCQCSPCAPVNCSGIICDEGFAVFKKDYECTTCRCRKVCPGPGTCHSHVCPTGYQPYVEKMASETECITCGCQKIPCPTVSCDSPNYACPTGFEPYVKPAANEGGCDSCDCRRIACPNNFTCESYSCEMGYEPVIKPPINSTSCASCECQPITCPYGYSGSNCEIQFSIQTNLPTSPSIAFNRKISLQATAKILPVEKQGSVTIEWSLFTQNNPTTTTENIIQSVLTKGITSNMRTISLRSESLQPFQIYTLQLSVGANNKNNIVQRNFTTGSAPTNGMFIVSPKNGTVLIDTFKLEARDWSTLEKGEIQYSFGYVHPSTRARVLLRSFSYDTVFYSKLPITGTNTSVYVQVRSPSGDYTEVIDTSVTIDSTIDKVSDTIIDMGNKLSGLNGTDLESQLNIVVSAVDSFSEQLGKNDTSKLIDSLIDTLEQNRNEISSTNQVQTIKILTQNSEVLSTNTSIKAAEIVGKVLKGLNGTDADLLDSALQAVKNLAEKMISSNSTTNEKSSFVNMLNELTSKLRQDILEGESKDVSMKDLEAVITRLGRDGDTSSGNHTIYIPVPNSNNSSSSNSSVSLQIETETLSELPSVYVQGEIYTNPQNQYDNSCNSQIVSPTVTVKWFNEDQQPIVINTQGRRRVENSVDTTVPLYQSNLPISSSQPVVNMSSSYEFICKYYDEESGAWINDTSVCETVIEIAENSPNQVTCRCYKPTTHAISLDYIQTGSDDNEEVEMCTNPCGCSLTRSNKSSTIANWAIALIVLACITFAIIVILILVVIALILFKIYQAPKSDVETVAVGTTCISWLKSMSFIDNCMCFKPQKKNKAVAEAEYKDGLDRWWSASK